MSGYSRVIPRDLFNEANLLKCLGQVYLNLERCDAPDCSLVADETADDGFDIGQNENSGAIFATNVTLFIQGEPMDLFRPLNSRHPWPLRMVDQDGEETPVFNDDGSFTDDMKARLSGPSFRPSL